MNFHSAVADLDPERGMMHLSGGGGCLASWDRRAASLPRCFATEKERATEQTCERKRKREREKEEARERERESARERDTWGRERGRDWLSRSRKSPPGCSTGRHFAQFSTALRLKRSFRGTFSLSLSLSSRSASRDRLLDLGIPRSLRERQSRPPGNRVKNTILIQIPVGKRITGDERAKRVKEKDDDVREEAAVSALGQEDLS